MDISPWLSWVWNHGRIGRVKLLGPWSRRFCCCYTILHKMLGYCNYCIWSWPIATSRIHTYARLGMHEHDWNTFWDAYGWSNFCGPRITVTIQNFQPYQQHLSSVQNSSWLMIIGVYTSHIVDGRNPAPPWMVDGMFTIYQLAQDLFHPQYLLGSSTVHWGNLGNPATWGQYHQLRGIFGQHWGGQVPKWRWWVDLNDLKWNLKKRFNAPKQLIIAGQHLHCMHQYHWIEHTV